MLFTKFGLMSRVGFRDRPAIHDGGLKIQNSPKYIPSRL